MMTSLKLRKMIPAVLIVLIGCLSFGISGFAQSKSFPTTFDCTKATSKIDRTICEEKELANADLEMGALYTSLLSRMPVELKDQLQRDQMSWLKNRNKSCTRSPNIIDCIKNSYHVRISILQQLAAHPEPGSGYPLQWFEGFELHNYYKDGKPPKTLGDVRQLYQANWEYPVTAYGPQDAVFTVENCAGFFKAKKEKFYPESNPERGPYSYMGAYCTAAKIILDGKPAQRSFIENLAFDGTIAKYLPASVEYIISNEQKRHGSGSWADAEKVKAVSVTKEEIEFSSKDATHFVRRIAAGDFDGDGVRDILIVVGHHVKGGTHFEISLYRMTRFGTNDLLRTIAKYTALEED